MRIRSLVVAEVIGRVRKQIATAHLVGEFAVGIGSRRVGQVLHQVMNSDANRDPVPGSVSEVSESQLAIASYLTLSAIQIVDQLESLSAVELRAIADFERAHRMRRTVLFKINQLLSI